MRKIICITLLLYAMPYANAQVKFGLKGAPQLTWSRPDNKVTETNGTRLNFAYGLMVDYYFTENYAIGTEFLLQSFGTNLAIKESRFNNINDLSTGATIPATDDLKFDYRLRYLQVPVLLKMRTKEIGYTRYYAEFGFTFGFLTKAKADINMANAFIKENVNVNNPDDEDEYNLAPNDYGQGVKSIRGGLVFGAGIQYNIFSNSLLVAGLRYDNSYSNFMKDDRLKTTLNYVALNVGVLF